MSMQQTIVFQSRRWKRAVYAGMLLLLAGGAGAQEKATLQEDFHAADKPLLVTGRGACIIQNDVLQTKDAYVAFGDQQWSNYEIRFRARTPEQEEQVQIWAGFHAYNRNDRYIVALRGGTQNNLYLSRLGYMGTDEFLALRTLDFHPVPGTWYDIRIEVCGPRIRVFLGKETLPRIDVTDRNSQLAPAGAVTLGGGWIKTEYDDLSIQPLSADRLQGVPEKEWVVVTAPADKEKKRQRERAAYQSVKVNDITAPRTTISLDGTWLFMPAYELPDVAKAVSPEEKDNQWHTMNVPDFWNPIRIWLHGETFGKHAKGASDAYFQNETARCEGYTFDYKKTSVAWYRQWMELPQGIEQKNTELVFDAVSKVAEVYINGQLAGKHTGMFGEFRVNGKGLFKAGKNLVTVKVVRDYVKDIRDAGKVVDVAVSVEVTNKMLKDLAHGFYNNDPAGIWQPVSLVITDPLKIQDVYIRPSLTGASFDVTVQNTTTADKIVEIRTWIADLKGKALYQGDAGQQTLLKAGEEKTITYAVKGLQPLLWTPHHPNLYNFTFAIQEGSNIVDSTVITSGFRTFESKNGYLYLNGKRYWLRGGNHTPFALAPNSTELAERFYDLMKEGNIDVTRTHTTPYNNRWITAADQKGIGISFEGTWPWLMINGSMPEKELISLWADEYLDLLKKYRNHPSILFWTINNEMKFYDNDPDFERAKVKMKIISDVVKRMRKTDNTRPICFDSNYKRDEKKYGKAFFNDIDDGDIDDIHAYINWYDYTLFKQFNGEFQKKNLNPGRPLISQEMSSGYPNNETGHPTRFYTQVHQTPQTLVGDLAYEYSNPAGFLESQAFITGEQAEAYRRSNDSASGIIHFALLTWFKNVYDAKTIAPYPTYYALKRALQPVLVSAELWGRHFYAGEKMPVRICVVNDKEDGSMLNATTLNWQLVAINGTVLASGNTAVPAVPHYARQWMTPDIIIPATLPADGTEAKLQLTLTDKGTTVSVNEYKIILAAKNAMTTNAATKIVLLDGSRNMKAAFDFLHIAYTQAATLSEALAMSAPVYVLAGLDPDKNCTVTELHKLRALIAKGAKVLLPDAAKAASQLYPEYITGFITPTEGDIANMDIPESPVFKGIGLLDLRYFNNNKREVPTVCNAALSVHRNQAVEILAKHIKVHGYVQGEMEARSAFMSRIQGATIVKVHDTGTVLLSTMSLEKATTDPVAGKLLVNMLNDLLQP